MNLDYHSWSFHPLFHYRDYTRAEITQWEFLWPLLTYDRFGEQYKYQFLYLFDRVFIKAFEFLWCFGWRLIPGSGWTTFYWTASM